MFRAPEVGEFVGAGSQSFFFRLNDYPRLGVLIPYDLTGREAHEHLERELERGRLLRKHGISVPRYVGIKTVRIPKELPERIAAYSREELNARTGGGAWRRHITVLARRWAGTKRDGLVIEHIEGDLRLVATARVDRAYRSELRKLHRLGITPNDSKSDLNALWSAKKQRLYLIDFSDWHFP